MNFSELERLAYSLSDTVSQDSDGADRLRWANEAQREITRSSDGIQAEATDTTLDGISEYALPSDFWKERRIELDGLRMQFFEFSDFQEYSYLGKDVSVPIYNIWNNNLLIYTGDVISAGSTITYYYYAYPTEFSGPGSICVLDADYSDIIPYYMAAKIAQVNGDDATASLRLREFQARLSTIVSDKKRTKRETPRYIKRRLRNKYGF